MSIRSGGCELFIGKKEINLFTFMGNRIKIPYENMNCINYAYRTSTEGGFIDFENIGGCTRFEFGRKNNDQIRHAIDYIKENGGGHIDIIEVNPAKYSLSQRNWFITILLFIVPILGVYLMWKNRKHSKLIMTMLSVFFLGLWPLLFFLQTWTVVNQEGIMTMEKYNMCELGMTYDECVQIIGAEGEIMNETEILETHSETYCWYGSPNTGANAIFIFMNGKLYSKGQVLLQ